MAEGTAGNGPDKPVAEAPGRAAPARSLGSGTGGPGLDADLAAVIEAVAAGDRDALKQLYDRFGARLYGVAHRILRDHALAEDALQEAFVKIWRKAGTFDRARGSATGWAAMIVRRTAFDLRPREPVGEPVQIADERPEPELLDPGLARALEAIPEKQKQALLLMHVHGLTHSELAAAMGAPLGSVKSWVRRGAATLKRNLGGG